MGNRFVGKVRLIAWLAVSAGRVAAQRAPVGATRGAVAMLVVVVLPGWITLPTQMLGATIEKVQ
jgi:hypothetical protein